ncbi:MAG: hypothetical protein ACRDRY_11825 [Pseudonocardiaceae bacterium]
MLPPAAQTHELVKVPGAPLVVVSQQSNSQLVKLWLDSTTEQTSGVQAFPLGRQTRCCMGWHCRPAIRGSSIISANVPDVIIRVTFDDGYTRILGEEVAALPTQHCKAHRLLPLNTSVLVTELTSATVAQLVTEPHSLWDQPTTPTPGEPS